MQTQSITLDFCRNEYKTITVKQYDKDSRNLLITCTDNGVVYKLDSSTQECNVKMNTPDNRAIYNAATINEDGKVFITFDENMVYDSGTGQLEIHIIEQSTKRTLSSMILTVIIVGSVYSDDKIIASDEFNALTDALLSIDEAYQKASEAVEAAQEVTDRVEKFEEQAVRAETVREQNEQLRQENTTKAINASNAATTSATQATSSANTAASQAREATTRLEQLERQVEQTETVREQNEQQRKETAVRAENAASAATSAASAANNAVTKAQEAANRVEQLEDQIEQAESVREQNEQKRQSNTSQAVSASNAAASAANQATSNANKAAQNANTATDRANAAAEACEGVVLGAGLIPVAEKGAAGGVATLDSDGTLTDSQMPSLIYEKSGTTLTLNDSVAGGLKIDRICGGSKQETTSGKNKLNLEWLSTHVNNGITYTANRVGGLLDSVNINGEFVDDSWSVLCTLNLPLGTYKFTYGNDNVVVRVLEGWNAIYTDDITVTDTAITYRIVCNKQMNGGSINNQVIYPMIRLATETDDTYEPYTNGASPNPEYEQPIVSAGQKLAKGKNLLDCSSLTTSSAPGITIEVIGDGGVYLNGTKPSGDWTHSAEKILNLENGTYTLSHNGSIGSLASVRVKKNDSSTDYFNGQPFIVDGTEEYVRFFIRVDPGKVINNETIYPMLNAGSTALPWEPYTGGVKKAYDVGISKKLTGKNLLDCRGLTEQTINGVTFEPHFEDGLLKYILANGTATDIAYYDLATDFDSAKNSGKYFSIYCDGAKHDAATYNVRVSTNSSRSALQDITTDKTVIGDKGSDLLLAIRIAAGCVISNVKFYPMLYAEADTTYEPYTEQTLTLNHVLRGIPLGTDIPEIFKSNALHMAGIYWDEKEQQYYIADTIDAERVVLVQRVLEFTISNVKSLDSEGVLFGTDTIKELRSFNGGVNIPLLCDNYVAYSLNSARSKNYAITQYGQKVYIANVDWNYDLTTANEELAANPITVCGILATPIETPMTDEEIIVLHQLKTYQGVTHIFGSNDPDATMIFKYSSSEIGGVTLENSNLHAVNEVLRRRLEAKDEKLQSQIDNLNGLTFTSGTIISNRIQSSNVRIKTMFVVSGGYRPEDSPFEEGLEHFVIYVGDDTGTNARQTVWAFRYGGNDIYKRDMFNDGWITEWCSVLTNEDIPYKVVIDDTAGTIDFIDR